MPDQFWFGWIFFLLGILFFLYAFRDSIRTTMFILKAEKIKAKISKIDYTIQGSGKSQGRQDFLVFQFTTSSGIHVETKENLFFFECRKFYRRARNYLAIR